MQHIRLMSNFNAWANKLIYAVCSQLSDQEYRIDRKAFLGSIRHMLNHLILVDRIWICRFLGYEDSEIHSLDQILFDDFEELQQARIDEDQRLIDLIDSIDQSQLDQILQYKPMCGENTNYAFEQILLTVFNHQTHHRGQVHAMLTQCGRKVPGMDLIDYLAELTPG